ncbi:MAG: helix-turn-helix transcriptional regulator [Actinomycetota bacterium]|nr:helix-turn-helix transcriptional regulator [Actinomycetota bacterium]
MRGERQPSDRAVYVISVVADLAGMHPQTLRMYERKGLIEPKRTAGNSRRYSEQDVQRLRRIQQLTQDYGLNLSGVRLVMELERQLESLQARLARANRRLAETEKRLAEAEKAHRTKQGLPVRLQDVRSVFEMDTKV